MAIKIQKTSDLSLDSVKCIVYGGAGVGKTRLCATAPRPIIISAESGLLSLADVDCDYVEIHSFKELESAYRELKDHPDYDTICLDSVSEIAEELVVENKKIFKDGRQAYGQLADDFMPLLKKFRDIQGKNTVFTCKLIVNQDEESGKISHDLLIPGRVLGHQIPYIVDELFCLKVDRKGKQILQTTPDRYAFAKDRSGALDAEEREINMTYIFNKIMAKRSKGA